MDKKRTEMLLLTTTQFRNNLNKYFELAITERVAVKTKQGIVELTPSASVRTPKLVDTKNTTTPPSEQQDPKKKSYKKWLGRRQNNGQNNGQN